MGRTLLLVVLTGCLLYVNMASAARGGGGGKGRGGSRKGYGSRMPVLIQHHNPASASYYDHKDVSTCTVRLSGLKVSEKTCSFTADTTLFLKIKVRVQILY
jgi:hypothetical protein